MTNENQYSLIMKLTEQNPNNRPSISNVINELNQMMEEYTPTTTSTTNAPLTADYMQTINSGTDKGYREKTDDEQKPETK